MDYFQHVKYEKPMAYPHGDVQQARGQADLELRRAGKEMKIPKYSTY